MEKDDAIIYNQKSENYNDKDYRSNGNIHNLFSEKTQIKDIAKSNISMNRSYGFWKKYFIMDSRNGKQNVVIKTTPCKRLSYLGFW